MMVDLALLQSVSYIAGALGVCVAAVYYVMNLRITQRNQELTLKALEQSAKTQELTLKSQEQNLDTRQAQLFQNINEHTHSKEFLNAVITLETSPPMSEVDDFVKMHRDMDLYLKFYHVCGFYEGLGVLVRENLINVRLVAELWSGDLMTIWDRFGVGIRKCREAWNMPRYLIEVEYLCLRVAEYGDEHPELQIKVPKADAVY